MKNITIQTLNNLTHSIQESNKNFHTNPLATYFTISTPSNTQRGLNTVNRFLAKAGFTVFRTSTSTGTQENNGFTVDYHIVAPQSSITRLHCATENPIYEYTVAGRLFCNLQCAQTVFTYPTVDYKLTNSAASLIVDWDHLTRPVKTVFTLCPDTPESKISLSHQNIDVFMKTYQHLNPHILQSQDNNTHVEMTVTYSTMLTVLENNTVHLVQHIH